MTVIARTPYGSLKGEVANGVAVFRGISYARPPIGPLRFRPPQPPEVWEGVRDATEFGPVAMQNPSPMDALFGRVERPATSEDCLTLNVWTPVTGPGPEVGVAGNGSEQAGMLSLDGDARRPVMVWIHGGAFVGGSGSTPWYDGGSFARRGGVVLVTLNYRLGAFGFLHLQDLAGEAFAGSGNVGILDQVAALRWVQQSIAAFGGDPDNVTIFGESAGAMSVGTLLGLPAARGLFRRAILQSGGAGNIKSAEAATEITERLLAALDLRPEQAEDLRALPPEALLAAQARVAEDTRGSGIPFEPVIDGAVLPRPVLDSIAAGDAAAVSMLAGTTLDEMRLFTAFDPAAAISDDADLLAHAQAIFGFEAAARAALTAYKSTRPEATASDIWSAILTDQVFRIPAVRLLDRQSRHQPQTWAYLFTWPTPVFDGRLGSCHAIEIPFVFNTLEAPGAAAFTGGTTEELRALAERMHDAWVAFARTGDPNHAGLPAWPQYNPDRRATMLLDTTCAPSEELYAELPCWDTVAGADSPSPAPRAAGLR